MIGRARGLHLCMGKRDGSFTARRARYVENSKEKGSGMLKVLLSKNAVAKEEVCT